MTLQPFLCDFDGTYTSGRYRLVHSQVGFGIDVVDVLTDGKFQHRTTGHNALNVAMAWCRDNEAGAFFERPLSGVGGEG